MSRSISGKVKINSYADIISGDDTKVTEVPLADLYPFKDHPFRVLDDSKMKETVDSIKRYFFNPIDLFHLVNIAKPRNYTKLMRFEIFYCNGQAHLIS